MSGTKKAVDLSEEFMETFLATIDGENGKEIVRQIVRRFIDCELPVKTKQYDQSCMEKTYRILCFTKKSAEAVIINNRGMGRECMSIQVRINDRDILNKIDGFNQNIKDQILNAKNCEYCSSNCEDKKYVFTYQTNEYVKCHFLCFNFFFQNMGSNDIDGIMYIINNEIAYAQTRVK